MSHFIIGCFNTNVLPTKKNNTFRVIKISKKVIFGTQNSSSIALLQKHL